MAASSVPGVLQEQIATLEDEKAKSVRQFDIAIAALHDAAAKIADAVGDEDEPFTRTERLSDRGNHEFLRVLHEQGEVSQRQMRRYTDHFRSGGGVYSAEQRLAAQGLVERVGKDGRAPIYALTVKGRMLADRVFGQAAPEPEPEPEPTPEPTPEPKPAPKAKPKAKGKRRKVNPDAVRQAVMEYVGSHPRVRMVPMVKAVMQESGFSESSLRRALDNLVKRGLINRHVLGQRHVELTLRRHGEFGATIRPGEETDGTQAPTSEPHSDPRPAWAR